jgi:hypothetical protein
VACRPVTGQRPRDKQIDNSCYWVVASQKSIFVRQQLETATHERCFLCGAYRDVTSRRVSCSKCKGQTRPLAREGAPHRQTRNCLTVIKIWSWAPDGCLKPRQTGRLTVRRNITLISDLTLRVDSWSNELVVRESPAGKKVSTEAEDIVEIRPQATTGEDTADWEEFMCAVVTVISGVCNTVRLS